MNFKPKTPNTQTIPRLDWILLLALALLFIGWQTFQAREWAGNSINLLESRSSINFYQALKQNPLPARLDFAEYPPLSYWVSSGFYQLFSPRLDIAYLSFICFTLVLIFPLYGLGFMLGGRLIGWLAVFLTLFNYWTLIWTRIYNLNFSEMAVFCLVFYLLLKTRGFADKSSSIIFGLALGIGLLTKYVIIFMLLPLIWQFMLLLKNEISDLRTHLLIMLGGLGIVAGLIWWAIFSQGTILQNYYLIFQFLGLALAGIITLRWVLAEQNFSPLGNFLRALTAALSLALPWYLATLTFQLGRSRLQFISSSHAGAGWLDSLKFFLGCGAMIYPGALIFLLLGLAFALYRIKERTYQLLLLAALAGLLFNAWLIPTRYGFHYFLTIEPLVILISLCWLAVLPEQGKLLLLGLALGWGTINLTAGINSTYPTPGENLAKRLVIRQYQAIFALGDIIPKGMYFYDLAPETLNDLRSQLKKPNPGILFLNLIPRLLVEQWGEEADIREFRSAAPYLERDSLNHWEGQAGLNRYDYLLLAAGSAEEIAIWEEKIRNKGLKPRLLKEYLEKAPANYFLRFYSFERN